MNPTPTSASERIHELDVLRGFALLGVFIVHFTGAAYYELPLDEAQSAAWAAQPVHATALFLSDWLFYNKANTLFATLFGMGFWVMLERLRARSDDFERIYLRRLLVLMAMGFANLFFIFPGDVLHEYAMIGLILFLARDLSARTMLIIGLALALAAAPAVNVLSAWMGFDDQKWYTLQREAFALGGYWDWVSITAPAHLDRDLLRLGVVGWASYLLGRFFLGAWIIRGRWIQRAVAAPRTVARWLPWVLGGGLTLEFVSLLIYTGRLAGPGWLEASLHALGAPLTAAGYALCLLQLLGSRPLTQLPLCRLEGREEGRGRERKSEKEEGE